MSLQFFKKDLSLNQNPKMKIPLDFGYFHLGGSADSASKTDFYGYPLEVSGVEKDGNLIDYKIYGNSKQGELPEEFTQLVYLETTGTQYIDTGLKSGKFVHDIQYTTQARNLMGFSTTAGTFWGTKEVGDSFELGVSEIGLPTSDRHAITYNTLNGDFTLEIEDKSISYKSSSVVDTYTLCHVNNSEYFCKAKIYGFYAYNKSGSLIQNLIPAKRISDNTVGMYDTVSNKFFQNAGTGEFLEGTSAPTEELPLAIHGVGVKTKNLFDKNQTYTDRTYLNSDGTVTINNFWISTDYIPVRGNRFTLTRGNAIGLPPCIVGYDSSKKRIASATYDSKKVVTLESEQEIAYIRFSINKSNEDYNIIQLEEGATSTSYEPYGYRIDILVTNEDKSKQETVTVYLEQPLYSLGDDKDYLDCKHQKVVRNIEVTDNSGTKSIKESLKGLSNPIDEPLALPELPVYEGKTIYTIVAGLEPSDMFGKIEKSEE